MTTSTPNIEAEMPPSHLQGGREQPSWVIDELPTQYGDLARQIAKLKEEARKYEGIAAVLWETGRPLTLAVRDLFAALQFDAELKDSGASYDIAVKLEDDRRLLVAVVGGRDALDKASPEIGRVLTTLQQEAGTDDRVVLATNAFFDSPLASRPEEAAAPEALRLVQGLGANLVKTSTLFGLWRYSLDDAGGARDSVSKLYALDGGIFR